MSPENTQSHDYEPPVDELDTKPFTWQEQHRAQVAGDFQRRLTDLMLWEAFEDGEITLTSVEAHDLKVKLFGNSNAPLQFEPDALAERNQRRMNWLSEGIRSFGRTVFRGCNDLAERLERAS